MATTALLYGREYGRWECGAIESISMIDAGQTAALLKEHPELKEQVAEVQEIACESLKTVAEWLQYAMGQAHATEILSQWEGYCRFCHRHLGVEATTVMRAYRLIAGDPAAEVLAVYPDAKADEEKAEERAGHWAGEWERRFEPR